MAEETFCHFPAVFYMFLRIPFIAYLWRDDVASGPGATLLRDNALAIPGYGIDKSTFDFFIWKDAGFISRERLWRLFGLEVVEFLRASIFPAWLFGDTGIG